MATKLTIPTDKAAAKPTKKGLIPSFFNDWILVLNPTPAKAITRINRNLLQGIKIMLVDRANNYHDVTAIKYWRQSVGVIKIIDCPVY